MITDGQFRIAHVAELTGVPEPTLRAWERRYKIPTPHRTPSGYRLYSQRDVEEVRRMRELCDGGLAAAEAARQVARERKGGAAAKRAAPPNASDAAVRAIVDAAKRYDDVALEREVRRLAYAGPCLETVEDVIVPALHEIGAGWQAGTIDVGQEHLATQRLSNLLRDFVRLAPGGPRSAIVACFADEHHDLGALAVAVRLAFRGFHPTFLGARTPPDEIGRAARAIRPGLVALSVTITPERERARELAKAYANACGSTSLLVGGSGAPAIADLVRDAGAHVVPTSREVDAWIERHLPSRARRRGAA